MDKFTTKPGRTHAGKDWCVFTDAKSEERNPDASTEQPEAAAAAAEPPSAAAALPPGEVEGEAEEDDESYHGELVVKEVQKTFWHFPSTSRCKPRTRSCLPLYTLTHLIEEPPYDGPPAAPAAAVAALAPENAAPPGLHGSESAAPPTVELMQGERPWLPGHEAVYTGDHHHGTPAAAARDWNPAPDSRPPLAGRAQTRRPPGIQSKDGRLPLAA
jgi:hypothetical protein